MDLNIGQNKWEEIMSVKDTIKKSVLESGTFAQYDMLKIMLAMTIALLMGCLIYMVLPQVSQQEQKCIPWFGEQRSL